MTSPILSACRLCDCQFERFGTAILPIDDMTPHSEIDAELVFDGTKLRYYVMRLRKRPPILASMTPHSRATQCLGSADAKAWWMAVADPALRPEELDFTSVNLVEVQPGEGVKLHQGTWHAGPYFLSSSALFFNLELSDTNLTDHNFHHLSVPIKLKLELS